MTTPLIFWPGEQVLANRLAEWLNCAPPVPAADYSAKTGLVLWHGPDSTLATCLTDASGVQNALTDWKRAARSLLAHARQNRRTLILVDAGTVTRDLAAALALRLGRTAPPDLPARPEMPLALALARLALHHDSDLQALLDDLTSASLPGPQAVANADLMEQVAAGVTTQLHVMADLTQDRDRTATELAALQDRITQQKQADQTRAAAAAQTETALHARLTAQDHDLTALRATAKAQTAELDLLRTQLGLGDTALSTQLAMGETRDTAATLRVQTLENQLEIASAETRMHLSQIAQQSAALTLAGDQTAAATAEITRLQALHAGVEADLSLLRTQLGLAQDGTAASLTLAQNARDAARLRTDAQIADQDQAVAAAGAENSLLRGQLALSQDAAASSLAQAQALGMDAARLDALMADHAAEVSVLTTQIALLDADLTRLLMAPPAIADTGPETGPDTGPTTADPAYWEKALARALASARHEADERARLEQDLAALRALGQTQIRRAEDQSHNRTLFAQMTKEATASLDEIARLSATVTALRDQQDL